MKKTLLILLSIIVLCGMLLCACEKNPGTILDPENLPENEQLADASADPLLPETDQLPDTSTANGSSETTIDFASIDSLTDLLKQSITLADIESWGYETEDIGYWNGANLYMLDNKENVYFCIDEGMSLSALYLKASIAFPQFSGKDSSELPFKLEYNDYEGEIYIGEHIINGLECIIEAQSPDKLSGDDWVLIKKGYQ